MWGLHHTAIPPEAPRGGADAVRPGVNRGELQAQAERPLNRAGEVTDSALVFAKPVSERLVAPLHIRRAFRTPEILAGRGQRQQGIKLLVLQQHRVTPRDPVPSFRSGGSTKAFAKHRWRRAARGDGTGERKVRRVHKLIEMYVRKVERLSNFVVAVAALVLRMA